MTREEKAIIYFKDMRKRLCEDYLNICPKDSIAYKATLAEKDFYDTAIEALEQEPCEDCISREDALQALCKAVHKNDDTIPCLNQRVSCLWDKTKVQDYAEEILKLPPVTPVEKQEPCTDAISRQAVLDLAKFDGRKTLGSIIHAFDVEQLPPVTAEKVRQSFEGMTNGEVIQALFPKIKVKPLVGVKGLLHVFFDKKEDNAFDEDWWNAPYKGGAE